MTYLERLRTSTVHEHLRNAAEPLRSMIGRPRTATVAEHLRTLVGRVRSFTGPQRVRAVFERRPRMRFVTSSTPIPRLRRTWNGLVRHLGGRLRLPALSGGLRSGDDRLRALLERPRGWLAPLPITGRRTIGAAGIVVLGCVAFAVSRWWPFEPGPEGTTDRLHVESGETVASLFSRAGLPDDDLLAVMEADGGYGVRHRPRTGGGGPYHPRRRRPSAPVDPGTRQRRSNGFRRGRKRSVVHDRGTRPAKPS